MEIGVSVAALCWPDLCCAAQNTTKTAPATKGKISASPCYAERYIRSDQILILLSFCNFQSMTMMFEVQDLAVASPATVSRCGMVYLEPSILGLEPFIKCWLQKLPGIMQPFSQQLASLFGRFLKVSYHAIPAFPWLGACQLRYQPA